ncbi:MULTISPECIES: HNH endonuclease [unclassified Cupriavidus]|uniref:HNH endonuclease n=1 Tax=unclassified Cupriavidus TaxID=2640874 RepID=UPI00313B42CF
MNRDPDTLQQLTHAHLEAAADAWQAGERVPGLSSSTPWEAQIAGQWYPNKAILALAHRLAGFGELTARTLAGAAGRQRLAAMGVPLRNARGEPSSDTGPEWSRLEAHDVESGAAELSRELEHWISMKQIAHKPHETGWRVGVGDLWFSPYGLGMAACAAAGLRFDREMTPVEYAQYRAHLESLGFPVKRGRTPTRTTPTWGAGELRAAAAALVGRELEAANGADGESEPLQVVLDGRAYPASDLLGLPAGQTPTAQDRAAIAEAGGALRAAPDPLDTALEALAAQSGLPTEVARQVRGRIGQGRFRDALLQVHGRCVLTGIAIPAVLRAAHIHRWADCADTPTARHDIDNGLLLAANLDCLFETGLIAFDDDGQILISPELDEAARDALGLRPDLRLAVVPSAGQRGYLAKHRERTRAMREASA